MLKTSLVAMLVLAACNHAAGTNDDGDDDGTGDAGGSGLHPDTPNGATHYGVRDVLSPDYPTIIFEIDYETGKAPYTGSLLAQGDSFDLSKANLNRLFAGRKTLMLPTTLAGMEDIGNVPDEDLTTNDLLAIANTHRQQHDGAGQRTFYLLFLGGYFDDGNGPNHNVLGVSLGSTGVVVFFKDVIASTGGGISLTDTKRYVEQATMIHELGHSVGLTNDGVPMATAHEDTAHPAHCDNDKCAMFWVNEGASEANQYVLDNVFSPGTILYDAHCLADVDAITGGPQ
ncbi:MAG TPA: hypothetical protein VGM90_21605 [Kofleriaceae bacterium]